MNPLLRLRQRLSTRVIVFVTVLLFSATAVEVAPHAIDVMQDLGWLAPDAAEAPAEAAALPGADDIRLSGSATGMVAEVDGAAFDRLVQFMESQPDAWDDTASVTGAMSAADQPDAAELLEGVVSLDAETGYPTAFASAGRSSAAGAMASLGLSAPAFGEFTAMTTAAAGPAPDTSVLVGAAGADGELASTKTDTTSTDKTASIETTAGSASTSAAPPAEATSGDKSDSSAGYALAEAPRGEAGTGAVSTVAEIAPVAVPEPATLLLLGAGLLFLARYGRRKAVR